MSFHATSLLAVEEATLRLYEVERRLHALRVDLGRELLAAALRRQRRTIVVAVILSNCTLAGMAFAAGLLR